MISPDVLYHLVTHASLGEAYRVAALLEAGAPVKTPRVRGTKRPRATTPPPARARTERPARTTR